ncbi:MAG: hypothetical protein H6696_01765 [Deferribacteres bacterium]|nr:hypothetical protein [candidate division KSB1 bacterium]MCB9500638.1 hypothetical protein [Deferribacteres bacterium]
MITQAAFIEKSRTMEPAEDYHFLRQKGIEYIEKLSGALWTDYNVHDPGITILEMLCYAITDLNHRCTYPVQDILAEQEKYGTLEKHFFPAREILTCNPVTIADFRKLLIDLPGIKNAWLRTATETEHPLFLDCKRSTLRTSTPYMFTTDRIDALAQYNVPESVRNDLQALFKIKYDTKEEFLQAAEQAVSKEILDLYHNAFIQQAQLHKPVSVSGLYEVILQLQHDTKYGDLNSFTYAWTVPRGESSFEIHLTLPSWDAFFACGIAADALQNGNGVQTIKFDLDGESPNELQEIPQSQKYHGTFSVDVQNGVKLFEFEILSQGLMDEVGQQAIASELQRTGEGSLFKFYQDKIICALSSAEEAWRFLHAHRNLCEDFFCLKAVDMEEIGLCAEVEVTAEADYPQILAEIYYHLQKLLAPPVNFYTLQEMLEHGKRSEDIFSGPKLRHGFIDDEELLASNLKEEIHVSDIIQLIMAIDGVVAVKKILVTNYYQGKEQTKGEPWRLHIGEGRAMRLAIDKSKVVFYRGLYPHAAKKDEVLARLSELHALDRTQRLAPDAYDFSLPESTHRDIESWYSMQNDFPLVYGVGAEGLPGSPTPERIAKARQLKAYLLFYDQILANFLSQLAHARDLFSLDPEMKKTYFSQPLFKIPGLTTMEVPGVQNLIKEFVAGTEEWAHFIDDKKTLYKNLQKNIDPILENQADFEDRKNRFFDHLMSRFNEQFSDYVYLMHRLEQKKAPQELLADKLVFLREYPQISHDRGKAFDLKNKNELWLGENVSGLQKRVCRLLGMRSWERRYLAHAIDKGFELYSEGDEWRFRLKNDDGKILLSAARSYSNRQEADRVMQTILYCGTKPGNYANRTAEDGTFYFNLVDEDAEIIARRIAYFPTAAERDAARDEVITFISGAEPAEGFHLVEHVLLRPHGQDNELFAVYVPPDCKTCSGFMDPYSFRLTAVVPAWPKRFRDRDFRHFFEKTLRLEAPAHTHVKICWVSREHMADFEDKYWPWLEASSSFHTTEDQLAPLRDALLSSLGSLRSIYEETRLFYCEENSDEDALLLNHSVLGTE